MRRIIGLSMAVLVLAACSFKVGNISDAPTAIPGPSGEMVFSQTSYSCAAGGTSFGFVAYFIDHANGSTVSGTISKQGMGGAETAINQTDIPTPNGNEVQVSNSDVAVSAMCGDPLGPGTYVMRMVRPSDSKVLASGQFVMVP